MVAEEACKRLHAQLGETDPLFHVPAPVMSRHVLFLLLAPPSAMFIDLGAGGCASLDPREMVLDEGVGTAAVGVHGPNAIGDPLARDVAEDGHAGISLGSQYLEMGPDMVAAEVEACPSELPGSGEEVDAIGWTELQEAVEPFAQAETRMAGVGDNDVGNTGRVGLGFGEESDFDDPNPAGQTLGGSHRWGSDHDVARFQRETLGTTKPSQPKNEVGCSCCRSRVPLIASSGTVELGFKLVLQMLNVCKPKRMALGRQISHSPLEAAAEVGIGHLFRW